MQVLQLSDEQIAMLPEDQRQSIMILKEQLARSAVWLSHDDCGITYCQSLIFCCR